MNCPDPTTTRTRSNAAWWKPALLSAGLALCGGSLIAQTTIIDPAGDGGFNNGGTFLANNWTVANSASVNQWYLGNLGLAGHSGTYAYVSNDGGLTNAYTISAATVSHFWRDVTIPAGETSVTLSFTWAALGETSFFDGIMVSLAPTSYIPAGSTTSLGTAVLAAPAVTIASLWTTSTVQTATLNIPGGLLGNCAAPVTVRLIFSWKNDTSLGTSPAGSVDNISLTSAAPAIPFSGGTFTIDNTLPTAGSNFNGFTAAINAVNGTTGCLSGPVTFNVTAGQTFNENPPVMLATGTVTNTITFQRSGAGANPVIVPTGSASTADAGITISGGDYITFDGIDINSSAVATVEYGYLVRNFSATDGAKNNTIQNCAITLNRSNTTSRGILQAATTVGGGVSATATTGTNDNNIYRNFSIRSAYGGVLLQGTSTTFPDLNNQVTTTACGTFNIIGDPNTPNDIGNQTTTLTYGILAANQSGVLIKNNRISNITTSAAQADGISLTLFAGTCDVSNNIIQNIRQASTTSTSAVSGIRATHFATGSHTLRVYNNAISLINSSYATATATRTVRGIFLLSTTGTSNYEVWHNSVSLTGTLVPSSSAAFETTTTSTAAVLTIRNNIFANFVTNSNATGRHFGFVHTSSATVLGAGASLATNNDIHVANDLGVTGFTAMSLATTRTTVGDWAGAVPQASANLPYDPLFVNNETNLMPQSFQLDGAGFGPAPAYITNELGCQARGNDIGAYQFIVPSCFPPTGTVVYVQDCANSQFFLDVTVTNLSGGPGVDVVSDYAGNPGADFTVGLGTYQIGPFPSNTNVNVSLLRNADATCDVSLGIYNFDCATNGQNALSFDGVNDGVNCGSALSLDITGTQITLEAWIYPTAFKPNAFDGNIINKEGGNAGYQLRCGAAGILQMALGNGTGYIQPASPAGTLVLNTWQHVAGTYDGTTARLYRNGVEVASLAATAPFVTSPNAMRIGDYAVTPGARTFAGKIDEARVWSVARSAGDIAAFMNQQLCGVEAGLAAYYRFDQGTAGGNNAGVTTLTDITANGNNGTLGGFALTGPSSNWVLGVTGMGTCQVCTGPPTAGSITGNANACNAVSNTLTLTGATFGLGISYQWKYGPVGGPYTNLLGTATFQNTSGIPLGSYEMVVDVTCSAGPNTTTTAPFPFVVNPVPTGSAAAGPACLGQTLNLTGTTDIGTTYAWTGPNSFASAALSPSIPAITSAAAGTYSFTATAAGCSSTPSTVSVVVNVSPIMGTVSATPSTICSGDNSQLSASATTSGYFQSSGGATWTDIAGTGTSVGVVGDDTEHNISIPSFVFNGITYTAGRVGMNGVLALGSSAGEVSLTNAALPSAANTAGNIFLAPWWDDLDIQGGASILTQTVGNRFIVQFNNVAHNNVTAGTNNIYFQIQMDLVTGGVYFVYQDVLWGDPVYDAGANGTVGIQWANSAGNFIQYSFNTASLTAGQVIAFLPNSPSFSWSPVTFLDNPAISNPLASAVTATTTYTVTATAANGCAVQATATVNTVPVDDGDPCTVDACSNGVASHTYTDTDADGTCDGLDGCPLDANKTAPGICGCGVADTDTDGDLTADCFDGCPTDPNKIAPGICGCGVADTDTDGDLTADCNDACPLDPNKILAGLCGCGVPEGTCNDCEGTPAGPAQPGTPCEDNNACTINDVWSPACACAGTFQDTDGDGACDADDICPGADDFLDTDNDGVVDCLDNCPLTFGQIGSTCNDGDPNTTGDVVDALCVCAGTVPPCPNNLTILTLTTDNDAVQTTWDVIPLGGGTPLCSGAGFANNNTFGYNCCLPNGCYELRVFDSAGDGIANGSIGGYALSQSAGNKRIIDNSGDGIFTSTSTIANNLGFCVPLGNDAVLAAQCDKNDWLPNDIIQAVVNPAVTAQYGVSNANSGYQFWFFNPDGGYSRRVTQTHAAPGPVSGPPANIRSSYLRLSSLVTQPIPFYTNLNVRIRTQVAGVFSEFGPACRFRLDPPCTTTQLTTVADPVASCGATALTLTSTIYATAINGATTYQFEFSKPGYLRRIASGTRSVALSFVTNPLQNNTCYNVRLRVSFDGAQTYCPFGPSCVIGIGSVLCGSAMAQESGDAHGMMAHARFTVWPNPNDGQVVNISLTEFAPTVNTVMMEVTDVYGKLVSTRTIPVQDGYLNTTLTFEQDLAPGLYLVDLQAGEERYTERLVIQR